MLKFERVSVEDNFFDDLGAHSLLMARFCAAIRKDAGCPTCPCATSTCNPTSRARRAIWMHAADGETLTRPRASRSASRPTSPTTAAARRSSLFYVGFGAVGSVVARRRPRLDVCADRRSAAALSARSSAFAVAAVLRPHRLSDRCEMAADRPLEGGGDPDLEPALLPLLGGQDSDRAPRRSRSSAAARSTISICGCSAPGSARTPSSTRASCRSAPISFRSATTRSCARTRVLLGYKAQSNYIHIGPIDIGGDAFVGEASVLDIDTAMGDGAQLGHASSLQQRPAHAGRQALPRLAGGGDDHRLLQGRADELHARCGAGSITRLPGRRCFAGRCRCRSCSSSLLVPAIWYELVSGVPSSAPIDPARSMLLAARDRGARRSPSCWSRSSPGLLGIVRRPAPAQPVPEGGPDLRALRLPLLAAAQIVAALSNSRVLQPAVRRQLVHRALYALHRLEPQQGRADRLQLRHQPAARQSVPCEIGTGTMVSDGLSMINMHDVELARSSSSTRRSASATISATTSTIRPAARTGDNCLLGTKVMIPIDGPVRENVGLLGSPCLRDPARGRRATRSLQAASTRNRRQRHPQKNRHNLVTIVLLPAERAGSCCSSTLALGGRSLIYG